MGVWELGIDVLGRLLEEMEGFSGYEMAKAARSEDHEMFLGVPPGGVELSSASFQPEQRVFDISIVESDIGRGGGMLPEIV